MEVILDKQSLPDGNARPLCPVFGECGGCLYQNVAYEDELQIKGRQLKDVLGAVIDIPENVYSPVIPSPKPYHYRSRLDLKLKRTRNKDIFIGFTPAGKKGIIPVEACFIADRHISEFIPGLKKQAAERLPEKYRNANLVVRTGDEGKVLWGGIGRRSCRLPEKDYLWTEISGRRIFYSLDTFFQANLSILPKFFDVVRALGCWAPRPVFYDLYGGVGLFGVGFSDLAKGVVLIEENKSSLEIAWHNVKFNGLNCFQVIAGKVEDELPRRVAAEAGGAVAMVDPPRAGLSGTACQMLAGLKQLGCILYLSCNPESLARDLQVFARNGWDVQRVTPFDFFPKTKHLETLVLLSPRK
jgi:tRNA/tmRNA/rRNA uracil-C5-methylase (TrmA/RlmC/RlmD family)